MRILLLLFSIAFSQEYIVSDYDYTNQEYTFKQVLSFVKSYPNNKLTYSDVEVVYRWCVVYEINIIMAFAVMQKESDLLWNNSKEKYDWRKSRAFGYGLAKNFRRDGLKFYRYGGYEIQTYFAIKTMRKLFDEWEEGMEKEVLDLGKNIIPDNAGTYSLYRYCPFFGEHNFYNWDKPAIGNKAFEVLLPKLKEKFKEVRK